MEEICKNWSTWLKKTRFSYMDELQINQTLNSLITIRDIVIASADIKQGQKVADFGCGSGLLSFGILEKFQDSVELIFSDKFIDCLDECKKILESSNTPHNAKFLQSDVSDIKLENEYLDRALTRSVLVHVKDKF
ncbi:class I SAM-dependent methyltransferase, partial [bacterium]|nr:class I SAM-dependent methyltransferase [bacterium]